MRQTGYGSIPRHRRFRRLPGQARPGREQEEEGAVPGGEVGRRNTTCNGPGAQAWRPPDDRWSNRVRKRGNSDPDQQHSAQTGERRRPSPAERGEAEAGEREGESAEYDGESHDSAGGHCDTRWTSELSPSDAVPRRPVTRT